MEKDVKIIKRILLIGILLLAAYILKTLGFLFIPLILAVFLTLLVVPILQWFKNKKMPNIFATLLILTVFSASTYVTFLLIKNTASEIAVERDKIIEQLIVKTEPIIQKINEITDLQITENNLDVKKQMREIITSDGFGQFVKVSLGTARNLLQGTFIMLFFFFLMYGSILNYKDKIKLLTSDIEKQQHYALIFENIVSSISTFIKVKTLISFGTGLCFGLTAYFFGIDFPIFWGFIAFIINYVQMVGSIIITAVLIIFGFIQIDSTMAILLNAILLIAIQIIFGSILEPIYMGKSFSINTIFVLISIVIGGYLWGIIGLVMAVPILSFIKILLDNSEKYSKFGRILGKSSRTITFKKEMVKARV